MHRWIIALLCGIASASTVFALPFVFLRYANHTMHDSGSGTAVGWLMGATALLWIPLTALIALAVGIGVVVRVMNRKGPRRPWLIG